MTEIDFDQEIAQVWSRYKPPIRPSMEDIKIYESIMNQKAKTLLLGATPEIRSLAHQYEHDLTAVDISEPMYYDLDSLVYPKGNSRFICCDWVTMDLGEQFDLVIADGSINMLHPQQHQRFMENVAKHMTPNGLFVLHVHLIGTKKFKTVKNLFQWARGSDQHVFSTTKLYMDQLVIDSNQLISNGEYLNKIRELDYENSLTEEDYQAYDGIMSGDDCDIYHCRRHDMDHLMTTYFEVEDTLYATDYGYHEIKPFYCLRKRS